MFRIALLLGPGTFLGPFEIHLDVILIIIVVIIVIFLLAQVELDVKSGVRVGTAVVLGVLDASRRVVQLVRTAVQVHLRVEPADEQLQGDEVGVVRPRAETEFAVVICVVVILIIIIILTIMMIIMFMIARAASLVVGWRNPVDITVRLDDSIHVVSCLGEYGVL